MFQFIPALILLLLQSQGYAHRLGSDQADLNLFTTGYCQRFIQSGSKANVASQRAFLVRLLSETKNDPRLAGQILELLEAIGKPLKSCPETDNLTRAGSTKNVPAQASLNWRTTVLSASQRLRDGPIPVV